MGEPCETGSDEQPTDKRREAEESDMNDKNGAEKFRALRLSAGLFQREVADKMGLSEQAIHDKEAGRSPVIGRDILALTEIARQALDETEQKEADR